MFQNQPKHRVPKLRRFALCIAAAAAVVSSGQAQTYSERVRTNDLDLTADAGRQTLDRRIRAAVRRVCSRHITGEVLFLVMPSSPDGRCKREAMRDVADARVRAIERAFTARQSETAFGITATPGAVRPIAPPYGSPTTAIKDLADVR